MWFTPSGVYFNTLDINVFGIKCPHVLGFKL